MIIAIDGPAGSGKSTTAKAVASRLGFRYLDTGAMYRAVALAIQRAGVEAVPEKVEPILAMTSIELESDGESIRVRIDGEDVTEALRAPEVGVLASLVATFPEVRGSLVAQQRRMANVWVRSGGGVVLDGRDVGTNVFPDADVKVFMVADARVRARRRMTELREAGEALDLDEVLREIESRDKLDETRALAPLVRAEGAVVLDTTKLSIAEQVDHVVRLIRERTNQPSV